MLEIGVEVPSTEWAESDGWRAYKLKFLDKRGAPDRMFCKRPRKVLVEFKRPGEEPTGQQVKRARELREDGFDEIYWVDNIADFKAILRRKPDPTVCARCSHGA